MDDATGALSRVSVSPDGLVIAVDAARALAQSMLKRTELPEGWWPDVAAHALRWSLRSPSSRGVTASRFSARSQRLLAPGVTGNQRE